MSTLLGPDAKAYPPSILNKTPAYKALKVGDSWTMFEEQPIQHQDGSSAMPGDFVRLWFATNEPGRLFQIERIHTQEETFVYETTYIGFEETTHGKNDDTHPG